MTAAISIAEFDEIIREDLPWAYEIGMHADAIDRGRAVLRLPFRPSMLRPGGVVVRTDDHGAGRCLHVRGRAVGDRQGQAGGDHQLHHQLPVSARARSTCWPKAPCCGSASDWR